MDDEKQKPPGYSDAAIDSILQYISDPRERAERKALLQGFGTTLFVLDHAGLASTIPAKKLTEEDVDAMVSRIDDPQARACTKNTMISLYTAFGQYNG